MEMYKQREQNLRVFTFSELRNATHYFNKLLEIGEGGFGKVYKGSIKIENGLGGGGGVDSSLVVAIKKLNKNGLQVLLSYNMLSLVLVIFIIFLFT